MAKKTDQKTLDLIKQVKDRKAEISRTERYHPVTNCTFSYIEGSASGVINLNVESNIKTLISIAAFLKEREKSYKETAELLGVEGTPEFTWSSFTVQQWLDDIKARINKVQIATKKKALEHLETRLNAVISPELRAEMELEAISAELK